MIDYGQFAGFDFTPEGLVMSVVGALGVGFACTVMAVLVGVVYRRTR